MKRTRHSAEQTVTKLREADLMPCGGAFDRAPGQDDWKFTVWFFPALYEWKLGR
jgi:hypothetical protein